MACSIKNSIQAFINGQLETADAKETQILRDLEQDVSEAETPNQAKIIVAEYTLDYQERHPIAEGSPIRLYSQIEVDGKHVTFDFSPKGQFNAGPSHIGSENDTVQVKVVGTYSDENMTYDVVEVTDADGNVHTTQADGKRPLHITRELHNGTKPYETGLHAEMHPDAATKVDGKSLTGTNTYGQGKYARQWDKSIVNVFGSTADSVSALHGDELGDYQTLEDVMKAAGQQDILNAELDFDEEHSKELEALVESYMKAMKDTNDIKIKVVESTVDNAARGIFNPNKGNLDEEGSILGEVTLQMDDHGVEVNRPKGSMSNQEVVAHEMTHAVVHWGMDKANKLTAFARNQVLKLYETARRNTTWEHLVVSTGGLATEADNKIAQDMYRHVFGRNPDGTNVPGFKIWNGYDEFMAYSKTNRAFQSAMERVTAKVKKERTKRKDKDFLYYVDEILDYITAALDKVFNRTDGFKKGETVNAATNRLVNTMIAIKDKHADYLGDRDELGALGKISTKLGDIVEGANELLRPVVDKITEVILGDTDKVLTMKEATKIARAKRFMIKKDDGFFVTAAKLAILLPRVRLLYRGKHLAAAARGDANARKFARDMSEAEKGILRSMNFAGIKTITEVLADVFTGSRTLVEIQDMLMKIKNRLDRVRTVTTNGSAKEVLEAFTKLTINKSTNLKYNQALTSVILKTDIQSRNLSPTELQDLLDNPEKLAKKVEAARKQVENISFEGNSYGALMLSEANLLTKFMVTGQGLVTTAVNIASMFGNYKEARELEGAPKEFTEDATAIIDNYVTLKALNDTKAADKAVMSELITKDPEGVESFLGTAEGLQRESLKETGVNYSYEHVKGFVRDTYKNLSDTVYVVNPDAKELKDLGYEYVQTLPATKGDHTGDVQVWNKMNMLTTSRADGALALQNKLNRGVSLKDKVRSDPTYETREEQTRAFEKAMTNLLKQWSNPSEREGMSAYPIYSIDGKITDFAYFIDTQTKIDKLGLETKASINVGESYGMFGHYDEVIQSNKEVIDYLKKDFDENYLSDPEMYVDIAPDEGFNEAQRIGLKEQGNVDLEGSTPEGQMWAMLPKETKEYIRKVFGDKRVLLRHELVRQIFGYSELSVADNAALKEILGRKHTTHLKLAGKLWTDFISLAKNKIIIKLPKVAIGNIKSNLGLLALQGFDVRRSVKYLWEAYRLLQDYQGDKLKLDKLKRVQKKGEYSSRIKELEARLESNPHHELIEAGLYQAIAEDVSSGKDGSNLIENKLKEINRKLPEWAQFITNTMFLTSETRWYKFMEKVTQLSDYLFKYATEELVKEKALRRPSYLKPSIEAELRNEGLEHLLTDMDWKKPVKSKEIKAAINKIARRIAIDNHVNYPALLHPKLQWLDRNGFAPFIKYTARMQRVDYRLIKQYPANALATLLAQSASGGIIPDGALDSMILLGGGNRKTHLIGNAQSLAETQLKDIPLRELADSIF